jgi:hypothetical protein
MRRHDHDAAALLRQFEVVDIAAAAGDESRIFDPRDGLTDTEFVHAELPIFPPPCTAERGEGISGLWPPFI